MAASEIIKAVCGDEYRVLPCSVDPGGHYGEEGCFASVPCIVSGKGASPLPDVELSEEELKGFHKSCGLMKKIIGENLEVKK